MRSFLLAGAGVALLLGACSSESHPAAIGACTGGDAGCTVVGGSGSSGASGSSGSSGGDEGGSCTPDPSTSQCQQCTQSLCCAELDTCGQDTTCEMLLACIGHCTSEPCVTSCEQQYNGTAPTYRALVSCMTVHCPICAESGVGDPCSSTGGAPCISGTSCSGLWCTRTCTKPADCDGIGPASGNFTGQPGACRRLTSGYYCFPGCSGDTDCATFPGTYCLITTDLNGAVVQVCATGPDAGTD